MESLNIDGLIKTYSWLLDTLKSIQKEQSNAWTIDILRAENKKLRSENERLEEQVKWNNKHIRYTISRTREKDLSRLWMRRMIW